MTNKEINHIRIDRIAMTGPGLKTVFVPFQDGVNIVWGASNAGKSFVRKSIDYVFGGEALTVPKEGIGYDNFVLWLTTPKSGPVSLRRSIHGGDIYAALGHSETVSSSENGYAALKAAHLPQSANVSRFILQESGFREARLLKNERAQKSPFSLRTLIRYLLVDETRMLDEKSILLHHNVTVTSEDKGLIKFLLTGVDGSSVEEVRSGDQMKAARDGKLELLSQLTEKVRSKIDPNVSDDELDTLLDGATDERDQLQTLLSTRQDELDRLMSEVQAHTELIQLEEMEIAELSAMNLRFTELESIFASDIDRLSGLEEGGFLLQKFAKMNCPVCGASPENQSHDHGLEDVEAQRTAAEAEIAKIRKEDAELKATIAAATTEALERQASIKRLEGLRSERRQSLTDARRQESTARGIFTSAVARLSILERQAEDRRLLATYESEIQIVSSQRVSSRQRAEGLDLNLDLTTTEANELSKVIKQVLSAWNYPGAEAVHFSSVDQDIVVDGKRRRDNGAGIRAILHSAFKVALLVYCKEKGRPHPGVLILDSPLLAYREADEVHGELTDDELALRRANLAVHFYSHLHGLSDFAQFIVIENHKSDQEVVQPYPNVQFTRNTGTGRPGFFG